MWIIALGAVVLLPSFREMIKTIPITLGASCSHKYRKTLQLVASLKKIFKCAHWSLKQILKGKAQTVKELCILEVRTWLVEKFDLGSLIVGKKYCTLTYFHGDRKFRVKFPKKRGPRSITLIETLDDKNVTKEVIEMMGPSHNFHGISTSPLLLGYNGLKITYRNGMVSYYLKDDTIWL